MTQKRTLEIVIVWAKNVVFNNGDGAFLIGPRAEISVSMFRERFSASDESRTLADVKPLGFVTLVHTRMQLFRGFLNQGNVISWYAFIPNYVFSMFEPVAFEIVLDVVRQDADLFVLKKNV